MGNLWNRVDAFDRLLIASIALALIAIAMVVHDGQIKLWPPSPAPAATLTASEYAVLRNRRLKYYARLQEKREAEWLRGQAIAAVTE